MNITMNDLDINATLDQTAMAELVGGYSRTYGSWSFTGSSSTGIQKGATHMGNWSARADCSKRNVMVISTVKKQ